MIFDSVSFIDDRIKKLASDIEEKEVGLRVVYGGVYKIPCVELPVRVSVNEPRRFNVLEEFILRAADELPPPVLRSDLSSVFGLDPVFIETTCQDLKNLNILARDENDWIALTNQGREFYKKGYMPKPAEIRELCLIYTPLHKQIFISDDLPESNEDDRYLPSIDVSLSMLAKAESMVSQQSVTEAVIKAGKGWHAPEVGKTITGVVGIKPTSESNLAIGVLIIQDTAVSSRDFSAVSIRAFNFQTNQRDTSIEQYIRDQWKRKSSFLFEILPGDEYEEITTEIAGESQEQVATQRKYKDEIVNLYREWIIQKRQKKETGTPKQQEDRANSLPEQKGTVEYLWGDKIRPRFIQSLRQTNHTLMILSPWITEDVVDKEFFGYLRDLAEKRVACVIGWGIAKERGREDRIPPAELLASLNSIKTPDGIPSVTVWWLGNIHNKDCIIDYRINLSGSHNWLSYRGDRAPRGESIHYITIPDPVEQALEANEPLFIKAVKSVWDSNVTAISKNLADLERCCVAWTTLRRPDIALRNVDKVSTPVSPPDQLALMKLRDAVYIAMNRLPNNELSKIGFVPEVLESEAKLAGSIPSYLKDRDQTRLAQYLGRIAKANPEQLNETINQHTELWEQIGFLSAKQDSKTLVAQLAKFAEEKKSPPPENKTLITKKKGR